MLYITYFRKKEVPVSERPFFHFLDIKTYIKDIEHKVIKNSYSRIFIGLFFPFPKLLETLDLKISWCPLFSHAETPPPHMTQLGMQVGSGLGLKRMSREIFENLFCIAGQVKGSRPGQKVYFVFYFFSGTSGFTVPLLASVWLPIPIECTKSVMRHCVQRTVQLILYLQSHIPYIIPVKS